MGQLKAQSSLEFMFLFSLGMLMFLAILVISLQQNHSLDRNREEIVGRDYGQVIQREILVASQVSEGYYRQFTISDTVAGIALNITNDQSLLYVRSKNHDLYFRIPPVNGNVHAGLNSIRKDTDGIFINS